MLLAIGLELLWRTIWLGTPVYRRHLLIFVALGSVGALNCVCNIFKSECGCSVVRIVFDFFGAGVGLTVSSLPWLWGNRLRGFGWQRGVRLRRDPLAPLILVADPHWHESLVGLKEARSAYPSADWLFLGDLFDIWVGIPGRQNNLEREFLAWVKESRSNNIWVGLWLGNREFFLDHLSNQFDLMGEGVGGELVAEGLCWEHGDLVNSADWRYRLWAIISRSSVAWMLVRILPSFFVDNLVNYAKRVIRSNSCCRTPSFPDREFIRVTAMHCGKTFVTGHFHTYKSYGSGLSLPWAKDGKFMVWYNGEVKSLELM